MKRSSIVRFQIFLLFLLGGLLVWRATSGSDAPPGALVLGSLEVGRVERLAFRLDRPGRVRIDAVGSAESETAGPMAAYPWIVDRETQRVAWRLQDEPREKGRFLVERTDTLELAAVDYDLFFTSFGSTRASRNGAGFLGLTPHWTNDRTEWTVTVSGLDSVRVIEVPGRYDRPEALWDSQRDGAGANEQLLVSTGTTVARVEATGVICGSGCDELRMEDAVTGAEIWRLTPANSEPAGGMIDNRRFDGTIDLEDGVYRVIHTSSWGDSASDWPANPPLVLDAWGMRVTAESGDLALFDPWSDHTPVVSMLRVGDDQLLRTVVEVDEPVRVYVDAMGELTEGGSRYDYAWIERSESRERIWEQTTQNSRHAGGDDSNRRAAVFLTLEPGRYSVYYQSDGSYSYGSFSRDEPDHAERWGVALFVVGEGSDAVRVVEPMQDAHDHDVAPDLVAPDAPISVIPPVSGERLFEAVGLGNGQEREGRFELSRVTRLRVVAIGEIMPGNSYDYGWIETGTGDIAWEMSMSNTVPAGGDDRNRLFDGVITLPAGVYTARFHTDFSHAFGDFDSGAPADPGAYGIRIVRMPE